MAKARDFTVYSDNITVIEYLKQENVKPSFFKEGIFIFCDGYLIKKNL